MADTPSMPTDTPLLRTLGDLAAAGYPSQLIAKPDGAVRCASCGAVVAAGDLHVSRIVRLEGASDPADMLAVVAAVCPVCDDGGALVAGYGPEASREDDEVLRSLRTGTAGA